MKIYSLTAIAAATLLSAAATSCGNGSEGAAPTGTTLQQQLDNSLASSKNFADSLTAVDGTFIGGFFNAQMSAPNLPKPINKSEFIRGLRDAMRCDTADMSYAYGFNSGTTALQTFADLAQKEGINREAFINAILAALRIDSVSQEELNPVRDEFNHFNRLLAERAEERAKQQAVESEAGKANIAAAKEYVAQLATADDFKEVAPGIYARVFTPGSGDNLQAKDRVALTYRLSHLDGTEIKSVNTPTHMYVTNPNSPVLRDILPLMKAGEKAEFFVPFEHAYGEIGSPAIGVGPCEALMIQVNIEPSAN